MMKQSIAVSTKLPQGVESRQKRFLPQGMLVCLLDSTNDGRKRLVTRNNLK
ncbi:hypothetical protein H6F76_22510 [Leptolyngbya sp. FACHB-321]|uniref:hypothetical protein n=1 Tax=Leptolyngbya sp. FACHB-321 TaxID=2692807 RepID=UPI001683D59C|nr:hypothetical protein [Leptolyngbya sp. FACHB-321]MBD2037730.1 hypothetical protein [Leptolyngbya sp. FACHB-321]